MEERVPFQVQLEGRQHRRLKLLADRRGRSMGALIRESVEAYLASLPPEDDPLLELIGILGEDAGPLPFGDVARHHDEYVADYLDEERSRPRSGEYARTTRRRSPR